MRRWLDMLCVISRGNWNNGSNAGVRNRNLNNTRTNANTNVGFADSEPSKPQAANAVRLRGSHCRGLCRNVLQTPILVADSHRAVGHAKTWADALKEPMKRTGQLFDLIATRENLLAAAHRASQGKRSYRSTFQFHRNLGTNIEQLARELQDGTYKPHPCNRFWVHDGPKPRLIEAPAFRDLVVQHAVYAHIGPVFERRYIATSYACRKGKGTHKAADWLQAAMRRAPPAAWVLHVDVRKFFYSIDRAVLLGLLAKAIKCQRTLALMMLFAYRPEAVGVPIGNLLSQTFANVYLNSLDHFCKRTLKAKYYARYMDDSIMIAPDRQTGAQWLAAITKHLASLHLQISHHSLQPIKRGANFVGFRTWRRGRFVRPHVISQFRRAAKTADMPGVISRLGHAQHTCSFTPLIQHLKDRHEHIYLRLPQSIQRLHRDRHGPA